MFHFKSTTSLDLLRRLSGTSIHGTSLLGLKQAAKQIGFDAEAYECEIKDLQECPDLCILHVLIDNRLMHYILCFGWDAKKQKFKIHDPSQKEITYRSVEDLRAIWKSKALLLLKPTDKIAKAKNHKSTKWRWLKNQIREDQELLIVAIGLGLTIAVLSLSTAIYSQQLIDKILPSGSLKKIIFSGVLLVFILLIKAALSTIRSWFMIRQARDFNIRTLDYFVGSLLHLPALFFETRKTGDFITRMSDTTRIQRSISIFVGSLVIDTLMLVAAFIAMALSGWLMGYMGLVWLIIFTAIVFIYFPILRTRQQAAMSANAHNESHYIDTIQGIADIKRKNKQSQFYEITRQIYTHLHQQIWRMGASGIRFSLLIEISGIFFLAAGILYSSYEAFHHLITNGQVIANIQYLGLLMTSAGGIANALIQLQEARVAYDRMVEFTQVEHEYSCDKEDSKIRMPELLDFRIEYLQFGFPGRSPILKYISMQLRRGEMAALFGESGSGKSTLLQLVQKFYQPQEGLIKANGIALDLISTPAWRSLIGVVPQDIKIFNGTLLDNILLGMDTKDHDRLESIEKQFIDDGFDAYFKKLPQGYATLLGENGVHLSGGQKQLVGFARALISNPQFLILDEATNAMDRHMERQIFALLEKKKQDLIILMITHRPELAKKCDRIFILENGIISNAGSHETLMLTNQFYFQAWEHIMETRVKSTSYGSV